MTIKSTFIPKTPLLDVLSRLENLGIILILSIKPMH